MTIGEGPMAESTAGCIEGNAGIIKDGKGATVVPNSLDKEGCWEGTKAISFKPIFIFTVEGGSKQAGESTYDV